MAFVGRDVDAECVKGAQRFGHEPFAARFVDGRGGAIGEDYRESSLASGDGGGEARRAATNDEDIGVRARWRGALVRKTLMRAVQALTFLGIDAGNRRVVIVDLD
jgi:hypothetical protein